MRRVLIIAAFVLAALGALAIRVVIEGRTALAEGDDWMLRGKPFAAVRAYETAARWYLPLGPHVDDAYDRLRALAKSEEPGVALAAWRAIRSAARASRSLWTPHADDLAAADDAIAKLSARDPLAAPAANTTELREAWHLARLSRDSRPRLGVAALAGFGVLLWLVGFVVLARRGIDGNGAVVRRPALTAAAMIVVGLGCWAAGLYNA